LPWLWVEWRFLRINIFWCQRGAIADHAIPQLFGGEFTCSRCHEKQIIFVQNLPADKGREF
jgi:hypothetical protein